MSSQLKKPKVKKKQNLLIVCLNKFFSNALFKFLNREDEDMKDYLEWIKEIQDITKNNLDMKLETPLYDTCEYYYNEGCKAMEINYLFSLFIGSVFGLGLSLCFSPFNLIGLLLTIISGSIAVIYAILKKRKEQGN